LALGSLTTQSASASIGLFGVGGVMAAGAIAVGVGIDDGAIWAIGAIGAGGIGDGALLHTVLGST
jgi:hypothetical protein